MTGIASARQHQFLPWAIQETQDSPLDIEGSDGVFFWDSRGRKYLDLVSQIFNVNIGHGNARVIEAVQQQANRFCAASSVLVHDLRNQLSDRLARITPGNLTKSFYTNSGSEANEIAFALARLFTGRRKILAKYRSYHGTTLGTLSVCGDPRRISLDMHGAGAVRFFGPYCYRCDFGLEFPSCELQCATALENLIQMEGPETIAAIILEPFTAAAAGYPSPPGYLQLVRNICDRYGILMIADEVICGFGRTGKWFGIEHEEAVPDIITVAKGLTSGYVPMGAAIVNERVSGFFEKEMLPIGCTYTGHPLACAAALAVLDEYERLGAIENSWKMGEVMADGLQQLMEKHPSIGDVRSQGLFACIELVKDRTSRERLVPFNQPSDLVGRIKQRALEEGIYIFNRWNLILLAPPLIITEPELQAGIAALDRLLGWVDRQL